MRTELYSRSGGPRSALVTGAGRGIGCATAVGLAKAGFQVFAAMRTPSQAPPELLSAPNLSVVPLDVTVDASIADALTMLRERTGRGPDVVVNNAGAGIIGAVEEVQPEEFRRIIETNLIGAASISRAIIPEMRARGSGRIINIGSIGGRIPPPGIASYCASKAALAAFTATLRREVASFGIQVVLVEPGAVRTDMIGPGRPLAREVDPDRSVYAGMYRRLGGLMQASYERLGLPPERIADVIVRVATDRRPGSRYVVGVDAHTLALLDRLPFEGLKDVVIERMFGLVMSKGRPG